MGVGKRNGEKGQKAKRKKRIMPIIKHGMIKANKRTNKKQWKSVNGFCLLCGRLFHTHLSAEGLKSLIKKPWVIESERGSVRCPFATAVSQPRLKQ